MKAKTLLFLLPLSLFFSCQKQTNSNVAVQDSIAKVDSLELLSHNAKNTLDYIGTYKGMLPCADCNGLETIVCINENNTYNLKTKYDGKGDKIFEQKGTFTWNKAGNTIILEDVKSGPNQYFVAENKLIQLDLSGKKITGNLADKYILTKQSVATSEIETTEEAQPATVDLNNRMESQTVIKKVNPAVGKFTLAETKWKLIVLNGKIVKQKGKKEYFIKLNSKDGRFAAYAGCNNFSGSYVMPSSFALSFSKVATTMMACTEMVAEQEFSQMLEKVEHYKLNNESLTFFGKGKAPLARFEPIK